MSQVITKPSGDPDISPELREEYAVNDTATEELLTKVINNLRDLAGWQPHGINPGFDPQRYWPLKRDAMQAANDLHRGLERWKAGRS